MKIFPGIIARLHHTDRRLIGIAERAMRRVKEGTSAVLLQSGLNESWWADSMECYTYLRNVTDLLSDGKTPYERRFGQPFNGPIIPFGSLVEYHPITAKDQSRIHQFGKKVLPGLFLGYALYTGGIWKGDVLIADLEELETMDASEIYSKRLNAKEVIFPKEGEFIFPIADGRIKTPGGDQELRTSTLIRPRPIQGESHVDFLGKSEGSLPQPHDSFPDAGEAINDFWSMSGSFIYRHHVEPRVKLYSPREESFPIPLNYIDVTRTTHTNLDVKQEKRIDDYWNIDGSRDLSDPWTGFTQFTLLDEKAPDGSSTSGERLTRKQLTSRPDHPWPELWKSMGKNAKLKEKQKWSEEKIHLDNARKLRGIYFIDPEDKEFKETIKNARKKLETSVAPAMPCKILKNCGTGGSDKNKTKLACILEANESTRMRMGNSEPSNHEDTCSQIVLKCLYLARIGRPDILWSVNKLARSITKWTKACDKRLNRLISYIHHTSEYKQYCHVGNTAKQCRLGLFQDSDFKGDLEDSKSTSGGTLCVFGSHTFVPISWMCKKQTSVSHSSTESEIISLDTGLRLDGLPALELWDLIVSVLGNVSRISDRSEKPESDDHKHHKSHNKIDAMKDINSVPSNVQSASREALLYVCLRTMKL